MYYSLDDGVAETDCWLLIFTFICILDFVSTTLDTQCTMCLNYASELSVSQEGVPA